MASLLPTGETTFFDANGVPLAGGSVTFYIPGTTTPKDTWQNSAQTILNANPVTLDSAGRAIIYGSGSYRQIVKDGVGNIVWDQETAEPNSGAVSFGGTSGGSANAQTLSAAQFSYGDGQIISFVAGISNSGAMTIAVGGGAPIAVLKNSPSGPVALVSGDIITGNSYFIQYSAQLSSFQLLLSVAPAIPTGEFIRGYLYGLALSNNGADAANDIDIGAGSAGSDSATAALMSLSSTLTKRLDANWVAGSNQGGLDTGSKANSTWYYVFLIQRSDTGVVDALFSLSATSPTMPAPYDRKRRIGEVRTDGTGSIRAFRQYGDRFIWFTPQVDVNVTNLGTAATLYTLQVPPVQCTAIINARGGVTNSFGVIYISGPNQVDSAPTSTTIFSLLTDNIAAGSNGTAQFEVDTSTSQIRARSNAANTTFVVNTQGWVDNRGRLG